ncbi:unnamed protein product [Musa textilis]
MGGGRCTASSPLVAEALSLLHALRAAASLHLSSIWIKSDSLELIDSANIFNPLVLEEHFVSTIYLSLSSKGRL